MEAAVEATEGSRRLLWLGAGDDDERWRKSEDDDGSGGLKRGTTMGDNMTRGMSSSLASNYHKMVVKHYGAKIIDYLHAF
ncbi:hypothetical protein OsJ_14442 [Oryza sativa Japonica Group]|uniref:Uncharacterized protein n=1 Tax=Oryza sativa subsp. japonica TaxID=39947 RepID=B9FEP6_ORYSJ|nr:hypothetical protein OsJ_14442 [Oryza sativa Japonica Group]